MQENWLPLLAEAALCLGVKLDERQLRLFAVYHRELTIWNGKINLFSRRNMDSALLGHFIDSLSAAPHLPTGTVRVLDMGSGGGFPAIPLKIAADAMEISLVEASRKKASFLKQAVLTLQLKGVRVINGRMEDLLTNDAYRGQFDAVISRAAFKLHRFLKLGEPFLAPGGVLIAMKGPGAEEEIGEAAPFAAEARLCLRRHDEITLPVTGGGRRILSYGRDAALPRSFHKSV